MAEPYAFNPTFRDTTRDVVTPTLQSTKDLADKLGIKYDFSEILKIFQDAADKGIAVNKEMYDQATQKYYQNVAANSSELLSALRKNNAEAVNTGASRGVAAANELSAMLGMAQQGSDGALDLALQGMTLADKAAADKAQAEKDALEAANKAGKDLGGLANDAYLAQMQQYVAELAYLQQIGAMYGYSDGKNYVNGGNYSGGKNYVNGGNYSGGGSTANVTNNFADMLTQGITNEDALNERQMLADLLNQYYTDGTVDRSLLNHFEAADPKAVGALYGTALNRFKNQTGSNFPLDLIPNGIRTGDKTLDTLLDQRDLAEARKYYDAAGSKGWSGFFGNAADGKGNNQNNWINPEWSDARKDTTLDALYKADVIAKHPWLGVNVYGKNTVLPDGTTVPAKDTRRRYTGVADTERNPPFLKDMFKTDGIPANTTPQIPYGIGTTTGMLAAKKGEDVKNFFDNFAQAEAEAKARAEAEAATRTKAAAEAAARAAAKKGEDVKNFFDNFADTARNSVFKPKYAGLGAVPKEPAQPYPTVGIDAGLTGLKDLFDKKDKKSGVPTYNPSREVANKQAQAARVEAAARAQAEAEAKARAEATARAKAAAEAKARAEATASAKAAAEATARAKAAAEAKARAEAAARAKAAAEAAARAKAQAEAAARAEAARKAAAAAANQQQNQYNSWLAGQQASQNKPSTTPRSPATFGSLLNKPTVPSYSNANSFANNLQSVFDKPKQKYHTTGR